MPRHTFFCVDGHTCGNPVRLVAGGGPSLEGGTMSERRAHFLREFDWIRKGLMFEPRGHDMMSGSILYPALREDCDVAVLFIETSGCLPMCGHGTIGTVTFALKEGLISPRQEGRLTLDTPAGPVAVEYEREGRDVDRVRLFNVPAFLEARDVEVEVPDFGRLKCDIAYGGNFYAIFDPQPGFDGLDALTAAEIVRISPIVRRRLNEITVPVHPRDPTIRGVSHVMWTGAPRTAGADGRNAVFYGEKAIDRSPCGTGTSARMAQLHARGRLKTGDGFVHESIIGSLFEGRIEAEERLDERLAIRPSIAGWARMTGYNTIFIDDRDPFAHGFTVQ